MRRLSNTGILTSAVCMLASCSSGSQYSLVSTREIPSLIRQVKDTQDPSRPIAVWKLGRLGPNASRAIPALQGALSDPRPDIRLLAAESIDRIRRGAWIDDEITRRHTYIKTRGEEREGITIDALRWLARHQNEDGSWSDISFRQNCGRHRPDRYPGICTGMAAGDHAIAATALSVSSFLSMGYTHLSRDTYDGVCYGDAIRRGLDWLVKQQDADGYCGRSLLPWELRDHALATDALAEGYGLTGSPRWKVPAEKAVHALTLSIAGDAGWGTSIRGDTLDPETTAWALVALWTAKVDEIHFDQTRMVKAADRFEHMLRDGIGRNEGPLHDLACAGFLIGRIATRQKDQLQLMRQAADQLRFRLPIWDAGMADFALWYISAMAIKNYYGENGPEWIQSSRRLAEVLLLHDRTQKEGCLYGSLDPIGPERGNGGRVTATAYKTLCLSLYYRYEPVYSGR